MKSKVYTVYFGEVKLTEKAKRDLLAIRAKFKIEPNNTQLIEEVLDFYLQKQGWKRE